MSKDGVLCTGWFVAWNKLRINGDVNVVDHPADQQGWRRRDERQPSENGWHVTTTIGAPADETVAVLGVIVSFSRHSQLMVQGGQLKQDHDEGDPGHQDRRVLQNGSLLFHPLIARACSR